MPLRYVLYSNQQTSSWGITLMVVAVGYGMQHATGTDLAH